MNRPGECAASEGKPLASRHVMSSCELCFGDVTLVELVDRIAAAANAVAPTLGQERARELVDLMLRTRVTQSEACGHFDACTPGPAVFGGGAPRTGSVRPCRLEDPDPRDLPRIFAAAATDALELKLDPA